MNLGICFAVLLVHVALSLSFLVYKSMRDRVSACQRNAKVRTHTFGHSALCGGTLDAEVLFLLTHE